MLAAGKELIVVEKVIIDEIKERETNKVKQLAMTIVRHWYENDIKLKDTLVYEGINLAEPLEYALFGALIVPLAGGLLKK